MGDLVVHYKVMLSRKNPGAMATRAGDGFWIVDTSGGFQ